MRSILRPKNTGAASVFQPSALLREARRQKRLPTVPRVCVLDPDGDIVRRLVSSGRATPFEDWACYHTNLHTFILANDIVGNAVGAPFPLFGGEPLTGASAP